MAYLTSVHLKGYKSIRDTSITFCEGLNIVIGQNGSGKTNFFEFLVDVLQTANRQKNNTNYTSKILAQLDKGNTAKAIVVWSLALEYTLSLETVQIFDENNIKSPPTNEVKIDFSASNALVQPFLTFFVNSVFYIKYGIKTSLVGLENDFNWILSHSHQIDNQTSIIEKFLYKNLEPHIQTVEDWAAFAPNQTLLAIPPYFLDLLQEHTLIKDFRITCGHNWRKDRNGDDILYNINSEFFIDKEWWRWDDLSDGTKRLFHLIGHIFLQESGTVIIEEPELGLHPHQLFELMEIIKKVIVVKKQALQVILTTHAPQILDCLDTNNDLHRIIITQMTDEGTKMRHLTDEQQQEARDFLENNHLFLRDYWIHAGLEHQNIPL